MELLNGTESDPESDPDYMESLIGVIRFESPQQLENNLTSPIKESKEAERNRYIQIYVLFGLAGLGLFSNIVVGVLLYQKCRRKRRFTNLDYFIMHLTAADFLVAAFCVLADAVWKITFQWLAGDAICRIIKFMQMFSLYASTFIIVSISIDRCIAILNPIPKFDHHRVVRIMALISWVGSGLCSIPQLVVFGVQQAPTATPFYQCVTHGYYEEDWQETAYILATFTVMGAAPLFVIITCYTAIFLKLQVETHHRSLYSLLFKRNQEKIVSNESTRLRLNTGTKRDEIMRRAVMKSLWISLLVIITFIICWAPYYIAMLYYLIVRDANNQQVLLMSQIIFVFGMSNSVFNPIIYGASHLLCCRKSHLARGSTMRKGTRMTVRLSQRDLPQPPPDSPPIPAALRPLRTSRSL